MISTPAHPNLLGPQRSSRPSAPPGYRAKSTAVVLPPQTRTPIRSDLAGL
jgi:hypothetical protein